MLFVLISSADTVVMDGPEDLDSAVIRIILADSQFVYRVGILQLLTPEIDMRVVAQTDTAVECFFCPSATQRASTSAMILLDSNLISGTASAISELVRRAPPQTKIIAQLDEKNKSNTLELYRRGVSGIVLHSISPDSLVKCMRKVAARES